jgi:hypothetical protein
MIASLYSTSDAVADYIWTKLAQLGEEFWMWGNVAMNGKIPSLVTRTTPLQPKGIPLSGEYRCQGNTIVGMLVAFPMFVDESAEPEDDLVLVLIAS